MAIFTEEEIRRRQEHVRASMRDRGIDALFLCSADNVYYVSGVPLLSEWGRPMWAVLPSEGPTALIGAFIEKENMEEYAHLCDIVTYRDDERVRFRALSLVIKRLQRRLGKGVLGIELASLSADLFQELQSHVGFLVDASDILSEARIRKSEEELKILRLAGEIAKVGAHAFLESLTPGNTELAIAGRAVAEMNRALGALYPQGATSSYAYCQLGDHTLTPHLHPTGRRLERGHLVALNVFPVIWGYLIELERTYLYGDATDRHRELFNALDESFSEAKRGVRPGVKLSDLHLQATSVLGAHGLGEYVRHGTGHAHGIMVGSAGREEFGEIRSYNPRVMETGMVTSIEPGFYIPEEGGFRHSDVLVVTGDDSDCLTDFPIHLEL